MAAESSNRPLDQIQAGRVTGVHGLVGQVKVNVLSDVANRFDVGEELYVQGKRMTIVSSTLIQADQILLAFAEATSSKDARRLVGQYLTVPFSRVPELPDGEYFHFQLLGLQVVTDTGETLGEVTDILETGSNDVYVVTGNGGEVLIPALSGVITEIKLEEGVMLVALPEGIR